MHGVPFSSIYLSKVSCQLTYALHYSSNANSAVYVMLLLLYMQS